MQANKFSQALNVSPETRRAERKNYLVTTGFGAVAKKAQANAPKKDLLKAFLEACIADEVLAILPAVHYQGSSAELEERLRVARSATKRALLVDTLDTIDAVLMTAALGATAVTVPAYGVPGFSAGAVLKKLSDFGVAGIPVITSADDLHFVARELSAGYPVLVLEDSGVTAAHVKDAQLTPLFGGHVTSPLHADELATQGFAGACFDADELGEDQVRLKFHQFSALRLHDPLLCVNDPRSKEELKSALSSGAYAVSCKIGAATEDDAQAQVARAKEYFDSVDAEVRKIIRVNEHTVAHAKDYLLATGAHALEFEADGPDALTQEALSVVPEEISLVVAVKSVAEIERALMWAPVGIISFVFPEEELLAFVQEQLATNPHVTTFQLRGLLGGCGVIVRAHSTEIDPLILKHIKPGAVEVDARDWSVRK